MCHKDLLMEPSSICKANGEAIERSMYIEMLDI